MSFLMIDKKSLKFWDNQKNLINWHKKPKKIILKKGKHYKWFPDGQLNISYNCIDLNLKKGLGEKPAIIYIDSKWEEKIITFNKLNHLVINFTEKIKTQSKKIKQIMIHGSASIETAVSMLACARLAITHTVIFDELHQNAILKRIKLLKPEVIITRTTDKNILNFFIKNSKNYKYKIIHLHTFNLNKKIKNLDIYKLDIKNIKIKKQIKFTKSNKHLFNLFTSGSTGEPKGIVHSNGGYLIYSKYTCIKKFGMKKDSVVLCASDAGWINGHTYALYGPLSIGATTILIEKPVAILNTKNLRNILEKFKVTILYLPVTLIRMLRSIDHNLKYRSKHLRVLGSMGEPLASSVAKWYAQAFVKKNFPIVNTYFQTETGGILYSPNFNDKLKQKTYGTVGTSINGNLKLNVKKNENLKELKVTRIWPGCMIDIINGEKIWDKYWDKNGNFKLFDLGKINQNSCLIIKGRSDDVINIRGHRIGSEEIESILLKIKDISEVSAIAVKDKFEGHKIVIFCSTTSKKTKKIITEINNHLFKYFGSFALPKKIYFLSSLPKTRSGKIIRRVMREIFENPNKKITDLSTIINKNIIYEIKNKITQDKKN